MAKNKSYQYSIYKINNDSVGRLLDKIVNGKEIKDSEDKVIKRYKGYEEINTIKTEDEKYVYTLYIQSNEKEKPEWLKNFQNSIIKDNENEVGENETKDTAKEFNHNGIIFIENKDNDLFYAIGFNQAYHLIQCYCDKNFGLDIAEKIGDSHSINIKDSRNYLNNTFKILNYYDKGYYHQHDDYVVGQTIEYLKVKTINADKYGKEIHCGSSCRFNLNSNKLSESKIDSTEYFIVLQYLIELLEEAESLDKQQDFNIPRLKEIKDEGLKIELNNCQCDEPRISYKSEGYKIEGVQIDMSNYEKYKIFYDDNEVLEGEGEITDEIFTNPNIEKEKLNDYKISIFSNGQWQNEKNLGFILEKVITYKGKNYLYRYGKWYSFNNDFMKKLDDELDEFFDSKNYKVLEKSEKNIFTSEDEYLNKICSENVVKIHPNTLQTRARGKIELADCYDKNSKTLIYAKIGNSSNSLTYLCSQCKNAIKLIKGKEYEKKVIEFLGSDYEIVNVKLAVLTENSEYFKERNLVSFKMDLCDLKSFLTDYNINLEIEVAEYKKTKKDKNSASVVGNKQSNEENEENEARDKE